MPQFSIEVLLLDDEPDSLAYSRQAIARFVPQESISCAQTVEQALDILQKKPVQMAFLDVELAGGNGFDLCLYLHREYPSVAVVILTGHVDLGAKSYDYEPFDFLTKPVDVLRMERTFARFQERQAHSGTARVLIETTAGFILLNPADVCYISRNGSACEIHCVQGKSYRVTYPLDKLESMLAAYHFFRIHQSFLVPVGRIQQVRGTKFGTTYEAELDDGTTVPVSRNKYARLKAYLMQQSMHLQ